MTLSSGQTGIPLHEFSANIVDIRELARVEGRQVWQLLLDRTEFPSGELGGPAAPAGVLRAVSRSGTVLEVVVLAVDRDAHGQSWHTVAKPLQVGTSVVGQVRHPGHEPR